MAKRKRDHNDPPASRSKRPSPSVTDNSQKVQTPVPYPSKHAALDELLTLMTTEAEIDFLGSYSVPKDSQSNDQARVDSLVAEIQVLGGYQWHGKDRPAIKGGGHKYRLHCSLSNVKVKKHIRDNISTNSDKSITWNGQKFYPCHGTLTITARTDKHKTHFTLWLKHGCRHERPTLLKPERGRPPVIKVPPPPPPEQKEPEEEISSEEEKPRTDYECFRRRRIAMLSGPPSGLKKEAPGLKSPLPAQHLCEPLSAKTEEPVAATTASEHNCANKSGNNIAQT